MGEVLRVAAMTLHNCDCLSVLKKLDSECVDLVVTDPPYRIVPGGCSNDKVKIGRYTGGGY